MSNYTPFTGRRQEPSMPVLVEMLWRVVGPSGKPIACGVYRDAGGFEVRSHWAESVDALRR